MKLHELYEPSPVTFQFETPGWYLLAGIIFILFTLVVIRQIRKYIENRYRREALEKLENLDHSAKDFPKLFVVLKQTAIRAFGREKVGPLYGKEWLSFLENTGKDVRLTDYHQEISQAIYKGKEMDQDMQATILMNAKKWIHTHAG